MAALWLLLSPVPRLLAAQEQFTILDFYKEEFRRARPSAQAGVLQAAAADEWAPDFIGEFYEFVLDFVLENEESAQKTPDIQGLILTALRGLAQTEPGPPAELLGKLLWSYPEPPIQKEVIGTLGRMGREDEEARELVFHFLNIQNTLSLASGRSKEQAAAVKEEAARKEEEGLLASIAALEALGAFSYPVLFAAAAAGYSERLTGAAVKALEAVRGDYRAFILDRLRSQRPEEKLAALRFAVSSRNLTHAEQGELAQAALGMSMDFMPEDPVVQALQYTAVQALLNLKLPAEAALTFRYFYQVQSAYYKGAAPVEHYLAAVVFLGSLGSAQAAEELTLQLARINAQMKGSRRFNEALLLGLIHTLGELGNKIASEPLAAVLILPYPERVQNAARSAATKLQW